jgi:hypothetical protein
MTGGFGSVDVRNMFECIAKDEGLTLTFGRGRPSLSEWQL